MLGNYLIGLREGLEATLVVSILVAYLVKSGRRERLPLVWAGVAAALAVSIGFGALLTYVAQDLLPPAQRELFEAITSTAAVVFVTWMIFWMRRAARRRGWRPAPRRRRSARSRAPRGRPRGRP